MTTRAFERCGACGLFFFTGPFFRLERNLLEMQDRVSRLTPNRMLRGVTLGDMQQLVDELSSRKDLDRTLVLKESKLFSALGPNEENLKFFSQQKHTIGKPTHYSVPLISKLHSSL